MPTYEFKCLECGVEFELWRKMSESNPVQCSHCSSSKTERLMSLSAFQLKGDGWAHDSYGVTSANQSSHVQPAAVVDES